jgi:hypothetical protein
MQILTRCYCFIVAFVLYILIVVGSLSLQCLLAHYANLKTVLVLFRPQVFILNTGTIQIAVSVNMCSALKM